MGQRPNLRYFSFYASCNSNINVQCYLSISNVNITYMLLISTVKIASTTDVYYVQKQISNSFNCTVSIHLCIVFLYRVFLQIFKLNFIFFILLLSVCLCS